jgi:ankyrin repeat protein
MRWALLFLLLGLAYRAASEEKVVEKAIAHAVKKGDLELLRVYAKEGLRATSALPLHVASQRGNANVVRVLVEELGIDVNQAMSSNGASSLFIAARDNHLDVVRVLGELGTTFLPFHYHYLLCPSCTLQTSHISVMLLIQPHYSIV